MRGSRPDVFRKFRKKFFGFASLTPSARLKNIDGGGDMDTIDFLIGKKGGIILRRPRQSSLSRF